MATYAACKIVYWVTPIQILKARGKNGNYVSHIKMNKLFIEFLNGVLIFQLMFYFCLMSEDCCCRIRNNINEFVDEI